MSHDDLDDPDYDADRYDTAAGWDATKYQKKWQPKPPRKAPLFVEPKDEEEGCSKRPLRPLFGDLWGEREVAVLAGETGVGKSVLAVQLAELLARGRLSPSLPPRRVLYVDFEHTTNQFEDRYSAPRRPGDALRRIRYRFSTRFRRVVPGFNQDPEPKFRNNLGRYFCNELGRAVDIFEADIAIVDNLSFLMMGGRSGMAAERAMLTLRTITRAFKHPVSILVTACLRSGRTPGPIELRDLAGSSRIAELADTVFTLGRSHAGDDLRYLKHLKSRTATPTLNHENTPVLQLSRLSEPPAVAGGLKTKEPGRSSAALSLTTVHRPLSTVSPFLGLTFLGPSAERDHFPTPEKPVRAARQHKDAELLEFVLTGKYARYLER